MRTPVRARMRPRSLNRGFKADVFVIAPLDANTLAKLSTGMADNLLTCVARAWDFSKPIVVCPAMNTAMWASVKSP